MENKAHFSVEVFPPKSSVALSEMLPVIGDIAGFAPDFISVTYGAGGEGGRLTGEIASYVQGCGVSAMAHLTCAGATTDSIMQVVDDLTSRGVSRVLALRGDLPVGERPHSDFLYATDLIAFLRNVTDFSLAAACYPEGHVESANFDQDIEVMKSKADLGVDEFLTQLFFDNADYFRLVEAAAKRGVNLPVHAGVMPITNEKQILRILKLSGAKLPPKLTKMISRYEGNPSAFYRAGLNFAIDQISDLLAGGAPGIHLYAMNKPAVVREIRKNIDPLL